MNKIDTLREGVQTYTTDPDIQAALHTVNPAKLTKFLDWLSTLDRFLIALDARFGTEASTLLEQPEKTIEQRVVVRGPFVDLPDTTNALHEPTPYVCEIHGERTFTGTRVRIGYCYDEELDYPMMLYVSEDHWTFGDSKSMVAYCPECSNNQGYRFEYAFDMDRVAKLLHEHTGLDGYVEMTGGGVQTIYFAASHLEPNRGPRYRLIAGPGEHDNGSQTAEDPSTIGNFMYQSETTFGADDEGGSAIEIGAAIRTEEALADAMVAWLNAQPVCTVCNRQHAWLCPELVGTCPKPICATYEDGIGCCELPPNHEPPHHRYHSPDEYPA